jgi:hypothetical protein
VARKYSPRLVLSLTLIGLSLQYINYSALLFLCRNPTTVLRLEISRLREIAEEVLMERMGLAPV